MSKRESKTRKKRSTPGRRLLSEIRPYSTFALSFNLPPVARPKDADGNPIDCDDAEAVEEWYRNRNTGKLEAKVRSVCSNHYFEFMNSEQTVHSISEYGYTLFGHPWIFENVPTVATFEHDIKILKRIAEKYPGLIREAIEVLTEKYTGLLHLSEDYLDWESWMPTKEIRQLGSLFDPSASLSRSDLQTEAIQYADIVLHAIPTDKNLRNGRPRLFGMRWFIQRVAFQWKCCSGIGYFDNATGKEAALFYAFITQIINAMYGAVPSKYRERVRRVVKTEDGKIKEIARNVLYEKDVDKRWRGSPN